MATVNFTVTKYALGRGAGSASIRSTDFRLSGQDTITTEEDLQDASGAIELATGEVFAVFSDGALRLAFGGDTATATTGHYVPANLLMEFEVRQAGAVSAIEAA